jgi:hypothetical protein
MAAGTGALDGHFERGWIGVAHIDQFAAPGMSLDGFEVVRCDAAATHQRKPEFAIGDGWAHNMHEATLASVR